MRVSSAWGLVGLVVIGWILVDIFSHPTGTSAAFSGVTNLTQAVGSQVTGKG